MLKLFEVTGFKNFKNTIKLDFTDIHDYKFNSNCITDNIIGKAIIYGKNSIGKSNFGLALFDIVSHLSNNHITPNVYDYYLNAEGSKKSANFRYVFIFDEVEIDYSYSKNEDQHLISEKLLLDNKLIYDYNYLKQDGKTQGISEIAPTLNQNFENIECILNYIVNNTSLEDNHPLRKMLSFVDNMLWFRSLDENRYIGLKTKADDYYDFINEDNNLLEFQQLLHDSGIKENIITKTDGDKKKRLYFDTKRPLPFFKTASSGTKALYTFFYWYKTKKDISIMFIDEFDAFYHFELSETIVSILEKMENTQVILTSHNTNLLTNRIMRPDCYFILTKDNLTSLANATTRELREGHNLEKLYMSGEFNG